MRAQTQLTFCNRHYCYHRTALAATTAATAATAALQVSVEGVGHLALPLCLQQAAVLKAVAEQALHGKGLRTVVDTAVRDALQVGGAVYVGLAGNCYFAGNPFLSGWL
jgi:hypothetical protein